MINKKDASLFEPITPNDKDYKLQVNDRWRYNSIVGSHIGDSDWHLLTNADVAVGKLGIRLNGIGSTIIYEKLKNSVRISIDNNEKYKYQVY